MSEPKPPPAIIKRQHVLLAGAEARPEKRGSAPGSAPAPAACGRKSVRFLEEGGLPRAIEFTCGCGETTLVELVYETAPETKAGAQTGAAQ